MRASGRLTHHAIISLFLTVLIFIAGGAMHTSLHLLRNERMIHVKELAGKPELVAAMKANILARQVDADVDQVVELYTAKFKAEQELEALRAQANKNAELIKSVPAAEKASYVTAGRALKHEFRPNRPRGA